MMKYKALYQGMYDDLKDSDMMIDYACKIRECNPEDKPLADEIAKYAKFRLDHFSEFHKFFESQMLQDEGEEEVDDVCHCLWKETWKHMIEWHDCIQEKIDKY